MVGSGNDGTNSKLDEVDEMVENSVVPKED